MMSTKWLNPERQRKRPRKKPAKPRKPACRRLKGVCSLCGLEGK
jgi:hypothetical protein